MTALTTAERQSRRQTALDNKAQALGYPTWTKLETDMIAGKLEITKMTIYHITNSDYSKDSEPGYTLDQLNESFADLGWEHELEERMSATYGHIIVDENGDTVAVAEPTDAAEAVQFLAHVGHLDAAIQVLVDEVEPLCKTDTTELQDWLHDGNYYGDETPASLAEDWDEVVQEASEL